MLKDTTHERVCLLNEQLEASLATDKLSTFITFYRQANSLKGLPSDTLQLTENMTSQPVFRHDAPVPLNYFRACCSKTSPTRPKKMMILAIDLV